VNWDLPDQRWNRGDRLIVVLPATSSAPEAGELAGRDTSLTSLRVACHELDEALGLVTKNSTFHYVARGCAHV
jgi:hypothetical protein